LLFPLLLVGHIGRSCVIGAEVQYFGRNSIDCLALLHILLDLPALAPRIRVPKGEIVTEIAPLVS
jgi:hypothetical protein